MTTSNRRTHSKTDVHHVLLIEDDLWLAELQVRSLKEEGYSVRHVTNALEAIDYIDSVRPEVIVADVLLAGSTIFALLHELQSYDDTGGIPVVLCTNMAEQLKDVKLEDYGIRRVIDKSTMKPDDVVAAVRAVRAVLPVELDGGDE